MAQLPIFAVHLYLEPTGKCAAVPKQASTFINRPGFEILHGGNQQNELAPFIVVISLASPAHTVKDLFGQGRHILRQVLA